MAADGEPGFSLALGSGGARGFAHIGVLEVLAREGLRPRAIAGTSMGAFVGAMYAAGADLEEMTAGVNGLGLREIARMTSLTLKPGSLMSADRFEEQARSLLPATFAELGIPFACVACDLVSGQPVILSEGDLPRAVRASMTVPVLFDPVRDGERLLVDGVLADPVPVRLARELGGDPVVAVDVGPLDPAARDEASMRGIRPITEAGETPSLLQVGTRSLDVMTHWLSVPSGEGAAVVITPDVGGYFFADVLEGEAIVEAGSRAALASLPAVRAAMAESARAARGAWWRRLWGG